MSAFVLVVLTASLPTPAAAQCGTCVDETKIQAGDILSTDYFGRSVALSGGLMAVSANGHDHAIRDGGAVYVYRDQGYGWVQEAELVPAVPYELGGFGAVVAVSGDLLVVGAPGDYEGASYASYIGAVYVFRFDGTTWVEEQKLFASDGANNDRFGSVLAVDGGTIVVGVPLKADPVAGSLAGAAYVFRYNGTSWVEDAKLTASDAAASARFGQSVALSGDRVAIGASGHGGGYGATYMFSRGAGGWTEDEIVIPTGLNLSPAFGGAVALEGGLLAVGARSNNLGDGLVLVYRYDGASWVEEGRINGSGQPGDRSFGRALALDGGSLAVGAASDNYPGAAYLFKLGCDGWYEVARTTPADGGSGGVTNEYYGSAVAIDGDRLLVGAYLKREPDGSAPGAAYLEEIR